MVGRLRLRDLPRRRQWLHHVRHRRVQSDNQPGGMGRSRGPVADHRGHRDPVDGRETAQWRGEQARLAVVVRNRRPRRGRRPVLAGLPAKVRRGAHLSSAETDTGPGPSSGTPRPPTAGPGSSWPHTLNSGSPAHSRVTFAGPGRGQRNRTDSPPLGFGGGSGTCTRSPARQPVHRNPTRPGPGRPPRSKNRRSAPRHDVGRVLATGEASPGAPCPQAGDTDLVPSSPEEGKRK